MIQANSDNLKKNGATWWRWNSIFYRNREKLFFHLLNTVYEHCEIAVIFHSFLFLVLFYIFQYIHYCSMALKSLFNKKFCMCNKLNAKGIFNSQLYVIYVQFSRGMFFSVSNNTMNITCETFDLHVPLFLYYLRVKSTVGLFQRNKNLVTTTFLPVWQYT